MMCSYSPPISSSAAIGKSSTSSYCFSSPSRALNSAGDRAAVPVLSHRPSPHSTCVGSLGLAVAWRPVWRCTVSPATSQE